MSILQRFIKNCLVNVEYPKKETSWNVKGQLKNRSNQVLKFDVRGMYLNKQGKPEKKASVLSKADKMVFEFRDSWIILDIEEINKYISKHKTKRLFLDDLISELDWNIIIDKH